MEFGKVSTAVLIGVGAVIVLAVIGVIVAGPTMLLWNWLAPIVGLGAITFWEAAGLNILCSILFKSISLPKPYSGGW